MRERNGANETKAVELQRDVDCFKSEAAKNEAENRCLKARISEIEGELASLHNRLATAEEHQSQSASQLFAAERKVRETAEHAARVEDTNRTSQQLQHQLRFKIFNVCRSLKSPSRTVGNILNH